MQEKLQEILNSKELSAWFASALCYGFSLWLVTLACKATYYFLGWVPVWRYHFLVFWNHHRLDMLEQNIFSRFPIRHSKEFSSTLNGILIAQFISVLLVPFSLHCTCDVILNNTISMYAWWILVCTVQFSLQQQLF